MNKELIIRSSGKYIGKIDTPHNIVVIETQRQKSFFESFISGMQSFFDWAATTKAGSGDMDDSLEPPKRRRR